MKIGFTCSTFFDMQKKKKSQMLREAKEQCDYLNLWITG